MSKKYRVELGGQIIGETALESADPPMGVVSGIVDFSIEESPYTLFKRYCNDHNITINQEDEEFGFIDTQTIESLKVFSPEGVEISGASDGIVGSSIMGFFQEGYHITILGIPHPLYDEEFPHHRDAYDRQFGDASG